MQTAHPLALAIAQKNTEKVSQLLQDKKLLNKDLGKGQTAIFMAVNAEDEKLAQTLLSNLDVHINLTLANGNSLLIQAVEKNLKDFISLLINNSRFKQINHKNLGSESALFIAIKEGKIDIAYILLEHSEIEISAKVIALAKEKKLIELSETMLTLKDVNSMYVPKDNKNSSKEPSLIDILNFYKSYVNTLGIKDSLGLFEEYQKEYKLLDNPAGTSTDYFNRQHRKLTVIEKKRIKANYLWSKVVDTMRKKNNVHKDFYIKQGILKIKNLGYGETQASEIFVKIVDLLKNSALMVMSFNAHSFVHGFDNAKIQNIWERNEDLSLLGKGKITPLTARKTSENYVLWYLDSQLLDEISNNSSALPRYASLSVYGGNYRIQPIDAPNKLKGMYGKSYIVFRNLESKVLYLPMDSFHVGQNNSFSCTHDNLEVLISQLPISYLKHLVATVVAGVLPKEYQGQIYNAELNHTYIETWIPPNISFFDPTFIEHIHIDKSEYSLSEENITYLNSTGITYTNSYENPYDSLCPKFIEAVKKNNIKCVDEMLKYHPVLARLFDEKGEYPIQIAEKIKSEELISKLIKAGANPALLKSNKKQQQLPFIPPQRLSGSFASPVIKLMTDDKQEILSCESMAMFYLGKTDLLINLKNQNWTSIYRDEEIVQSKKLLEPDLEVDDNDLEIQRNSSLYNLIKGIKEEGLNNFTLAHSYYKKSVRDSEIAQFALIHHFFQHEKDLDKEEFLLPSDAKNNTLSIFSINLLSLKISIAITKKIECLLMKLNNVDFNTATDLNFNYDQIDSIVNHHLLIDPKRDVPVFKKILSIKEDTYAKIKFSFQLAFDFFNTIPCLEAQRIILSFLFDYIDGQIKLLLSEQLMPFFKRGAEVFNRLEIPSENGIGKVLLSSDITPFKQFTLWVQCKKRDRASGGQGQRFDPTGFFSSASKY